MEPADLNHPFLGQDAELEKILAHREPPLADNGFSNRVLAALPSPALSHRRASTADRQRLILCAGGTLAGLLITWKGIQETPLSASALASQLSQTWSDVVSVFSNPVWITVGLIVAGSIVYALLNDGRRGVLDE